MYHLIRFRRPDYEIRALKTGSWASQARLARMALEAKGYIVLSVEQCIEHEKHCKNCGKELRRRRRMSPMQDFCTEACYEAFWAEMPF